MNGIQKLFLLSNPENGITISNDSVIDEVTFSLLKETLLTKKLNSLSAEIDLSNLSTGVYF
jgi:hypothetical protein